MNLLAAANTAGMDVLAAARAQLAQVTKENDGCPMTITVEALDAQSSAMVSEAAMVSENSASASWR